MVGSALPRSTSVLVLSVALGAAALSLIVAGVFAFAVPRGETSSLTTAMTVAGYSLLALTVLAVIGATAAVWLTVAARTAPADAQADDAASTDAPGTEIAGAESTATGSSDTDSASAETVDRAEGSAEAQRRLLDDVRHELKTPITIVRGHLEMMDAGNADDVLAVRELGMAELDRMSRLIETIDLLASVEDDQLYPSEVDLATLTEHVGELVSAIPGHPWRVAAYGPGTIYADAERLVQAWVQLADNAAKYTPHGSPIEIGSTRDFQGVQLWVRDHGPGIPPSARHAVFRRFHRGHGRRSAGGSGLGLAIVEAITKAHGGRCSITDTPGGGATVSIHLALRSEALPAPVRAGDVLEREVTT